MKNSDNLAEALYAVVTRIEEKSPTEDGWRIIGFALIRGDRTAEFINHAASYEEIDKLVNASKEWLQRVELPQISSGFANLDTGNDAILKRPCGSGRFGTIGEGRGNLGMSNVDLERFGNIGEGRGNLGMSNVELERKFAIEQGRVVFVTSYNPLVYSLVRDYFTSYGKTVKTYVKWHANENYGFGFITYQSAASAQRAITRHEHIIGDKKVRARLCTPADDKKVRARLCTPADN